ncbi:GEVED domain-containing protein [Crocinitomicaceae bacterium]|nr:GEVED domain-containing protein [Crocinitomicaceae bacterium]
MKALIIFLSVVLISTNSFSQKEYKVLMDDMSVNFYEVCESAENYFTTHNKEEKGSGWKGFQRWKASNEYKYYPSGDRSQIDPFFTENAFSKNQIKAKDASNKSLFGSDWVELGPNRIDSVTGNYSTGLGRIEDHYVDPLNPNLIYLGSRSGGFWKSIDGGVNWLGGSTDFLIASGVNTLTVSPTNPDSILINIRNARNGNSHGLYRSIDGGDSWTITNFNPLNIGFGGLGSNFKIYEIRYHPRVPNLIFIGTSKGIYRSDDNLVTWTPLLTTGDIEEIQFHPTNNDIIYLYDSYYWGSNQNFVLLSDDQGLSYNQSTEIVANLENRSVHLSVSNDCNNCLYFASDNGVWKSTDNGVNYNFLNNPPQGCGGFTVNDLDTSNMIFGYVDIEASMDGGQTFNQVTSWSLGNTNGSGSGHQNSFNTSTDYVHADLHPAKCVNGVFYVGTDGLFSKSMDNGISWENIGQGIAVRENYKLGVSQSNHYRSISGSQDNGTSIKHKNSWIEFYGADGMEGLIHPLNDDWMIGSLQFGGRRRTKDGGLTQTGASAPGQSGSGNGGWEAPIAYDPNNQMTVYNFSKYIFKSIDFGTSWDSIGAPSTFTSTISNAAIAENNSNIIVISNGNKIEKSINGGATFTSIKNNYPDHSIQDIAFDPNDDEVIIIVNARYENNGEKVFITTNGGASWNNITNNLGDMPIHSVVIDHTDSSRIYLGAEIGVYTKLMSENVWSLYNPNLPNTTIEELEIVNGSNTIKAATWGRGLWEYSLVGRNNFPSILITKITDQPTDVLPLENIDQYVTSLISYDDILTSVFVKWSVNSLAFDNQIDMTNTVDSTWVSNSPIPNQAFNSKIYFKVFAVGSIGDTTETYKFMYNVREEKVCPSAGTMSYQGNITYVNFNAIDNVTGKTQPYTDYTSTDSTFIVINEDYDLSVNVSTDNGNYVYYVTAWVDWNHDDDFYDSGEEYLLGSAQNVADAPTNLSPFTISIPSNAAFGNTIMRISCNYNAYQTDPCASGFDGEVEDYLLVISDGFLDLNENPTIYHVNLFPNPSTENVNLIFSQLHNNMVISLKNELGQVVMNEKSINKKSTVIDLKKIDKGIYFLVLSSDDGEEVLKIIKN